MITLIIARGALVPRSGCWKSSAGLRVENAAFRRVFAKEYSRSIRSHHSLMIDGETRMTESPVSVTIWYQIWTDALMVGVDELAYGAFLNWMYFSDATLTFPQTLVLRYTSSSRERAIRRCRRLRKCSRRLRLSKPHRQARRCARPVHAADIVIATRCGSPKPSAIKDLGQRRRLLATLAGADGFNRAVRGKSRRRTAKVARAPVIPANPSRIRPLVMTGAEFALCWRQP